jgi:serine/threonine-protein kinase
MGAGYSQAFGSGHALPPGVRLGEVVAGKYSLERVLGAGGMGVVVGAVHLQLDQRVAIKFMAPLLSSGDGAVERFMREARLAAHIRCEHVVRVFDVAALDDGTPYIVMEHLEGEDLGARLRRCGRLSVGESIEAILQAGEAIAEAHVAGVVHRDLKPGNLFVCGHPDGSPLVKVLDFGISKVLRRGDKKGQPTPLTGAHVLLGSPLYCSPEQIRASTSVDERADIWALGAILYELVSGTPPFRGTTLLEICTNVLHRSPRRLADVRPEVPRALDDVIVRALAKSPDERFGTIADFAQALAPFAPDRAQLSIERIESVMRGSARLPESGVAPTHAPCEKTLPSRPGPAPGAALPNPGRHPRMARWAVPVAVGAVAAAVSAAATTLATSTRHFAGARSTPAPLSLAAVATVAASATAPAETVGATPVTLPSASTSLAPLPEAATAPVDSVRRAAAARPAAPSGHRVPDTSEFGGLH